ncbi:hypothetical protein FGO68_gene16492 [Halteria grandinella]|uniref:Uncharacterized protein n=1 Tax=Halteria grandinella TaxID=5974 RepID=A0A8J8NYN3_HALGN|nr:hypothetical protein FGO68_gene16492 [Halteria grandinella]
MVSQIGHQAKRAQLELLLSKEGVIYETTQCVRKNPTTSWAYIAFQRLMPTIDNPNQRREGKQFKAGNILKKIHRDTTVGSDQSARQLSRLNKSKIKLKETQIIPSLNHKTFRLSKNSTQRRL